MSKGILRKMLFEGRVPGEKVIELRDARAMRALAHPRRLALLEHLRAVSATATQCAVVVGGSPSACSYHLRELAKWGFVREAGGGHGRERPWRATMAGFVMSEPEAAPAVQAASNLLRGAQLDRDAQVTRTFLERESEYSPEWRQAATFANSTIYATPDELLELSQRIIDLLAPYKRAPGQPASGDDRAELARVHMIVRGVPVELP